MFQSSTKQRLRAWLDIVDDMLAGDPPDDAHLEAPPWATHPHRRPLRWQPVRRSGSVPAAPAHCLCPVRPATGVNEVSEQPSMRDSGHALTN
jgi:hypothetical protein